MSQGLSIGQVAEKTGLSIHTLRFYEREGILPIPVSRDSAGRRVYTDNDVEWLMMCTMLRATGMPLAQVREYTGLVRRGAGNEQERLAVLYEHQERVNTQMRELQACLELITTKIGYYENELVRSAVDEPCVVVEDPVTTGGASQRPGRPAPTTASG
jgi:DNA-binding transcriptional MerR regulator